MTNFQVSNTPAPVWSFMGGGIPVVPVLFVNQDDNDTVTLGTTASVTPADPGSSIAILPPSGSISLPGDQSYYAVTDASDNPILSVNPGASSWSPSIVALASQIAASGLALTIAEEIAAQGLSLFGNPTPLYGGNQPQANAGSVGASLSASTFVPNTGSDLASFPIFDANISRPFNTVTRRYYKDGILPVIGNDPQNIAGFAAAGFAMAVTFKPFRDGTNTYGNNKIPGQGNLTFAQHLTAVKTAVAFVQTNAIAGKLEACLYHEMNGNGQNGPFGSGGPYGNVTEAQAEANYKTYVNFYGPAFKLATNGALTADVPLIYVPAVFSPANMVTFFPTPNVYHTGVAFDYYAQDFNSKGSVATTAVDSLEALADSLGFELGIWELGFTNGSSHPGTTGFPWSKVKTFIDQEITGRFLTRLQQSKPNGSIIWFAAPGPPGPSVNRLDPSYVDASVMTSIQNMFDQLTSTPSSTSTIGPGATVILTPFNPTPGAGFAIANGISYDITVNQVSGGTGTIPFTQVRLDWFNNDTPLAQPVDTQIWRLPIGQQASTGTVIQGRGPQRGQFLQISVTNLDTVNTSVLVQVNSTSRSVLTDIWKWDPASSVNVHTFVLPGGASYGNSLGSVVAQSIPASGQKKFLFGMAAGWVFIRCLALSGVGQLTFEIDLEPTSDWGSSALLKETPVAANNGEFFTTAIMPRGPFSITITNADASAHNASIQCVSADRG